MCVCVRERDGSVCEREMVVCVFVEGRNWVKVVCVCAGIRVCKRSMISNPLKAHTLLCFDL